MYKKPVIVFEGKKIDHIKIREPGGCFNAEKIRKLILDKKSKFNKNTDLLLYLAARSENMLLLQKYYRKKIILIDRFTDSTIAYQHYGLGVNIKIIKTINKYLLKDFKIDFTFLNTVSKTNMFNRLNLRKKLNRYDKFDYNFYKKVQEGFLKLSKINKKKYQIINSNISISENRELIIKKIDKLI